jgi:hypothetical protein
MQRESKPSNNLEMSSARLFRFDNAAYKLAKAIHFDEHPMSFPGPEDIHQAIEQNPDVRSSLDIALKGGNRAAVDVMVGYHHHPTHPFSLFISQGCEMGYRTNHNFGHDTWYLANLPSYPMICGVWVVSREKGWKPERLQDSPRVSIFVIAKLVILAARVRAKFWAPCGPGFQLAQKSFIEMSK